jgi:hypothetical protein
MNRNTQTQMYEIRVTEDRGRGLFALTTIEPRTLVHAAPAIVVTNEEYTKHCKYTIFEDYLYQAPNSGSQLLALGDGSLFNHSCNPNIDYRVCLETQTIFYYTHHKPIQVGEELCIYYGTWADEKFYAAKSSSLGEIDTFCASCTSDDEAANPLSNVIVAVANKKNKREEEKEVASALFRPPGKDSFITTEFTSPSIDACHDSITPSSRRYDGRNQNSNNSNSSMRMTADSRSSNSRPC